MLKWFLGQKKSILKKKIFLKNKTLTHYLPPTFCRNFYQDRVISIEKFMLYKIHLRSIFEYVCLLGKKRSKREEDKKDTLFDFVLFLSKNKALKISY